MGLIDRLDLAVAEKALAEAQRTGYRGCARREVMNALTVRGRKREGCVPDAPVRDCGDGRDRW